MLCSQSHPCCAPMSSMGVYSLHSGRTLQATSHNNPQTPYSAVRSKNYSSASEERDTETHLTFQQVSSFNLPATYDSQLITPVSMSASPAVPRTTASPMLHKEKSIKLSPSSPVYYSFTDDEGFGGSRFNEPMKTKDGQATLYISTPESTFPTAPYPDPYFGNFGVSGTASSTRTPITSPPLNPHQSPNLSSAGGLSTGSQNSRQPTPSQGNSLFRSHSQAPILIAPNPGGLRKDSGIYRQNSLHSNHSHNSTPHSQGPPQMPFSHHQQQESHMLPSNSKKRKTPDSGLDELLHAEHQLNHEERLLIRFTEHEQLPWKDVMVRFNEETGKSMKVPALQMRKKRLLERLRVWNDTEERALTMAMEDYEKARWETIARDMLKHGSAEKWTKEAVQRKWAEMHPGDSFSYRADSYFSPAQSSGYDLANRGIDQSQRRPSYSFGAPGSLGGSYQLQSVQSLHQRHPSLNETKREGEDYQQNQPHSAPQLPQSHPLHALQQAAQSPPLRSEPEAVHSFQTHTSPMLSHYSPPVLSNITHQQHLSPLPSVLTHPQQSPSLQARKGSASSGPISTVSTVTMDEVRSRAGSDASQQMAMHQKQAQMLFEQQKRREESRTQSLMEVGGTTPRSNHGLAIRDQNQGLGLGLSMIQAHNRQQQQQGQSQKSPRLEAKDQQREQGQTEQESNEQTNWGAGDA